MVARLPYQMKQFASLIATKVAGKPLGRYVDAVAIDAYPVPQGSPEDSAALLRKAHRILAADKVSAPLWNVEINYGVAGNHVPVTSFGANKQASYVVRTFLLDAADGVQRVYWLGWAHIDELAIQMVRPDQVTPTAAGKAYAMVRSWMIGQTVPTCVSNHKTRLYSCKTVRAGHASWVYWTTAGKTKVTAPKGSRHLQRMLGSPTRTHAGKRFVVTTAPVRVSH